MVLLALLLGLGWVCSMFVGCFVVCLLWFMPCGVFIGFRLWFLLFGIYLIRFAWRYAAFALWWVGFGNWFGFCWFMYSDCGSFVLRVVWCLLVYLFGFGRWDTFISWEPCLCCFGCDVGSFWWLGLRLLVYVACLVDLLNYGSLLWLVAAFWVVLFCLLYFVVVWLRRLCVSFNSRLDLLLLGNRLFTINLNLSVWCSIDTGVCGFACWFLFWFWC